MSTLFKNCNILTKSGEGYAVIENGFLGVEGSVIDYIGRDAPQKRYDEEKCFENRLLVPGFINCHSHSPMVLLRGVGSDLPLQKWLFDEVFPIEDRLSRDDIRAGSYLAILEMIACGTTSFSDMYMEPVQTIEAVIKSGMKANICRPVQAFDPNEAYGDNFRAKESLELFKSYNMAADGRIRIDFSIHAEYTCNENVVRGYSEDCQKYVGRMHIHLSETKSEHENCIEKYGVTPTMWFNNLGTFESPTEAAHCVWVTDEDMAVLKEKGVSVVHNPTSNMKLGSGFAPIPRMIEQGINVALGTDGAASNNNLNMLEEMHLASVIHNGYEKNAEIMKPEQVLDMATVNGAKLQGRDDTGVLQVGKKADIAALNFDGVHMYPVISYPAMLSYSAQGSDVCMTMADGKILYENGEFKTLDKEKIYYDVKKALTHLYG